MLNPEDKKDVKNAMGKAVANKVSKATDDSVIRKLSIKKDVPRAVHILGMGHGIVKGPRDHAKSHSEIMKSGGYAKENAKNKAIHAKSEWSASDEKAHQSDVKAGRSWNKMGRSGAKNPHM